MLLLGFIEQIIFLKPARVIGLIPSLQRRCQSIWEHWMSLLPRIPRTAHGYAVHKIAPLFARPLAVQNPAFKKASRVSGPDTLDSLGRTGVQKETDVATSDISTFNCCSDCGLPERAKYAASKGDGGHINHQRCFRTYQILTQETVREMIFAVYR